MSSLSDYKISNSSVDEYGDHVMVIIGIEKNNICNIELYGYDCDKISIEKRKQELETKFTDFLFVIKRFYSVL
jgi:uncharacterized protein YvpB